MRAELTVGALASPGRGRWGRFDAYLRWRIKLLPPTTRVAAKLRNGSSLAEFYSIETAVRAPGSGLYGFPSWRGMHGDAR